MNARRIVVACATTAACVCASAAQVFIKTEGTFQSGSYDRIGLFAQPGTDLVGYGYDFTLWFDKKSLLYDGQYGNDGAAVSAASVGYSMNVNGVVVSQSPQYGGADIFFMADAAKNKYILSISMNAAGPISSAGKGLTVWYNQDTPFFQDLMGKPPRVGMAIDSLVSPEFAVTSQVMFYNWDGVGVVNGEDLYSLLFTVPQRVSMETVSEPSTDVLVGIALLGGCFVTRRSNHGRNSRTSLV